MKVISNPLERNASVKRGRPRDLDKREAAIAAARQLFIVGGLRGTSMDAIADLAGISKVTLYNYFSDKDALFREALAQACHGHAPEENWVLDTNGNLTQRFTRIAEGFFDLITGPDAMALYRLMAVDPARDRKLSQLFFEAGHAIMIQRFAVLLTSAASAGELSVAEPTAAAAHFFFLLKGEPHMKLLLGIVDAITPSERRRHIDDVVAVFLRAYRVAG